MPFIKRAPKEEREKQKEIKKIVGRIEGLQQTYTLLNAGVSLQATKLKNMNRSGLGAGQNIAKAEHELETVKKEAQEYKTEIDHLKGFLSKLDPNHTLLQSNKPHAQQTERKHSHQAAMGADAPKVKVQSPDTIKKQVLFKDKPAVKKPRVN